MPEIQTPEWVKDAIFYQIFPDRFAKSDAVPKVSGFATTRTARSMSWSFPTRAAISRCWCSCPWRPMGCQRWRVGSRPPASGGCAPSSSRRILSIMLALVGVLVLAGFVGKIPWIALTLALTFALYGLMRKIMPVDGLVSLTVETLAMAPVALAYLGCLGATRQGTGISLGTLGLLALSGPVTTIPLLFFGAAARQLRLSTMGIFQYLSPTLQFLLAVVAFQEPFSTAQIVSFGCIWTAIAIYTADSYRAVRHDRLALVEPFGADP